MRIGTHLLLASLVLAACGEDDPDSTDQGDAAVEGDAAVSGGGDASSNPTSDPANDPGTGELDFDQIGTACEGGLMAPCAAGMCQPFFAGNIDVEGGYCSPFMCQGSDDCGGNPCVGVTLRVCAIACESDADCDRAGFTCYSPPGAFQDVCTPPEVVDFYEN